MSLNLPDTFFAYLAYMTRSTADRSDASTWGSRQPPPFMPIRMKGRRYHDRMHFSL